MILLDTVILVDYQRKHPPCVAWFATVVEPMLIPGFVAMEVIQDCRNNKELNSSLEIVELFDFVWPTADDMRLAFDVYSMIHLKNAIGLVDCLIGATAVGYNAPLATFNTKHFKDFPNLRTIQPY